MLEALKKKYLNQVKEEMKQEFLKQAAEEFDREFDQEFPTVKLKVKKPKPSRVKKITQGYTKAEDFIPTVEEYLRKHNGKAHKRKIAEHILLSGVLTKLDVHKHTDGVYRFYKTLDRTRRLMIARGKLHVNEGRTGFWELKQPAPF